MTDLISIENLRIFALKMDCWSKMSKICENKEGKMVLGKVVFKHHKLVSFQCKQFSSENQKDKEEDLT